MTIKETRRILIEKYFIDWGYFDSDFNIRNDGSVNFKKGLGIPVKFQYKKLPFKFNRIESSFDCSRNGLETLENFPNYVAGDLFCETNPGFFTEKEVRNVCKVEGKVVVYEI